jgi:hypothetical protein
MNRWLVVFLGFSAGIASAQERPASHPYSAPIEADGSSAHYRLLLPAAVYRGAARRDLGDMRVFNAAGEPVPYAFAARDKEPPVAASQAVNMFPVYGDGGKGIEGAAMRVQRTARGSVVNVSISQAQPAASKTLLGYLLDATEVKEPTQALLLAWQAPEGFSGQTRVEGSDDLKQWHTLAWDAPILFLEHKGARLERSRVELKGSKAKYLRVSFSAVPRNFVLREVRLELRPADAERQREWLSLGGKEGKERGELVFDSEGHFPVDRLRVALPQPNTVAEVQFLSRQRSEDPWRPAAAATVYRLGSPGDKTVEVRSPDVRTPRNEQRHWLLKVDQKGGGFGTGEVRLELGWLPHELVFAARGAAPFTLAYGDKAAKPGALPAASVIPRRPDGELAPAKLTILGPIAETRQRAVSLFDDPLGFARALGHHEDAKKWLLWSALVAAVLILAWMAFRLLRELGKQPAK